MPKERGTARERTLDAATALLLKRGYGATSLDEICGAAGVTKGGLFYHFASKEQLAAAAVERFLQTLVEVGAAARSEEGADAVSVLDQYVASLPVLLESPALERGCLLGAMAIQTAESHPEVWSSARDALTAWRSSLVGLIEAAAAERSLEVDAGELADGLLAAVEGGLLLDRSGASSGAAVTAVNHFRRYLSQLFENRRNR